MRDGRDFIKRLDELIFEPPRQENRAECGDQQAGQSGEQAEPDIVDQRRAVAPDLDGTDSRTVALDSHREGAGEKDTAEHRSRIGSGDRKSTRLNHSHYCAYRLTS